MIPGLLKRAIDNVFSDTSVPASTTKARLEAARDHIEELIQTLEDEGVESDDE